MSEKRDYVFGDVVQINEKHGRGGWIGAFVMVTEVKSFGVQGFVHSIQTHEGHGKAFIRLPFDQIDYIGKAVVVPGPHDDDL